MSRITVEVDGVSYVDAVEPRTLLVHYRREKLGIHVPAKNTKRLSEGEY